MNPLTIKHDDKELKLLRILAMGAVGIYLFRVMKKEGNLANSLGDPAKAKFKTRQMMDMGATVAESFIPPMARPIFNKLKNPLMNLASNKVNQIIGQDIGDENE